MSQQVRLNYGELYICDNVFCCGVLDIGAQPFKG